MKTRPSAKRMVPGIGIWAYRHRFKPKAKLIFEISPHAVSSKNNLSFGAASPILWGKYLRVMLTKRFWLWLWVTSGALFPAVPQAAELFTPDNFPGSWTLVTNADASVCAAETSIHRQERVVYSRILELQPAPAEAPIVNFGAAREANIHRFIANYRPPPIPYTSERAALKTGQEKFNCLEFAEDLVSKAKDDGIPAQVIGILFKGKWTGHAVAGFPTAEGSTLYFDSTPGAGQISHAAHQANVEVGHAYTREDGGELAVVGHLPITEIIPVTKLVSLASGVMEDDSAVTTSAAWVVTGVRRVPASGIDYADTNSLRISDDQLAKWNTMASQVLAAQIERHRAGAFSTQSTAVVAAARALAENEDQAARNYPYGQLRMGERYLEGDGVPQNATLARAYLRQAADQGSPTAIIEMNRLDRTVSGNSK
jgi:TPR repeat protein